MIESRIYILIRIIFFINREEVSYLIDCFSINKYQSVDENIPYIAMKLYKLIERPISVDKLFEKYSDISEIELSLNLERLLFLAMTFLFSIGLTEVSNNLVRRIG